MIKKIAGFILLFLSSLMLFGAIGLMTLNMDFSGPFNFWPPDYRIDVIFAASALPLFVFAIRLSRISRKFQRALLTALGLCLLQLTYTHLSSPLPEEEDIHRAPAEAYRIAFFISLLFIAAAWIPAKSLLKISIR